MIVLAGELSPILITFSGAYISDFSLKATFIGIQRFIPAYCETNYTHTVQTPNSAITPNHYGVRAGLPWKAFGASPVFIPANLVPSLNHVKHL